MNMDSRSATIARQGGVLEGAEPAVRLASSIRSLSCPPRKVSTNRKVLVQCTTSLRSFPVSSLSHRFRRLKVPLCRSNSGSHAYCQALLLRHYSSKRRSCDTSIFIGVPADLAGLQDEELLRVSSLGMDCHIWAHDADQHRPRKINSEPHTCFLCAQFFPLKAAN